MAIYKFIPVFLLSCLAMGETKKYTLEEKAFTIGTDLKVSDGGTVEERTLAWTHTYEYFDASHTLQASYKKAYFSWGTKYCLADSKGHAQAVFDKDVLESAFMFGSSYSIYDGNGKEIGKVSASRWPARFEVSEGGIVTMTAKRTNIIGYDNWEVEVDVKSKLPAYTIFFICGSKSAHDNRE